MQANAQKFPCEVIENMQRYMFNMGYLKDDLQELIEDNQDKEKKDLGKCLKNI